MSRFGRDDGAQSLVEFALALENVFDVEVPEEEVAELATVGDLVDALVEKIAVRSAALRSAALGSAALGSAGLEP